MEPAALHNVDGNVVSSRGGSRKRSSSRPSVGRASLASSWGSSPIKGLGISDMRVEMENREPASDEESLRDMATPAQKYGDPGSGCCCKEEIDHLGGDRLNIVEGPLVFEVDKKEPLFGLCVGAGVGFYMRRYQIELLHALSFFGRLT